MLNIKKTPSGVLRRSGSGMQMRTWKTMITNALLTETFGILLSFQKDDAEVVSNDPLKRLQVAGTFEARYSWNVLYNRTWIRRGREVEPGSFRKSTCQRCSKAGASSGSWFEIANFSYTNTRKNRTHFRAITRYLVKATSTSPESCT